MQMEEMEQGMSNDDLREKAEAFFEWPDENNKTYVNPNLCVDICEGTNATVGRCYTENTGGKPSPRGWRHLHSKGTEGRDRF